MQGAEGSADPAQASQRLIAQARMRVANMIRWPTLISRGMYFMNKTGAAVKARKVQAELQRAV
jgi:hypothetical protein